jgi:hypothetical protein
LTLHLPDGAQVSAAPKSGPSEIGCFTVDRTFTTSPGVFSAAQVLRATCDRTRPEEYPAARKQSDAFLKRLEEEVVVQLKADKPPRGHPRAER